jgi:hypothetical protein
MTRERLWYLPVVVLCVRNGCGRVWMEWCESVICNLWNGVHSDHKQISYTARARRQPSQRTALTALLRLGGSLPAPPLPFSFFSAELVNSKVTFSFPPSRSLFGWPVADGWCWFVLREEYYWLVVGGWFVLREKYCWLVPSEHSVCSHRPIHIPACWDLAGDPPPWRFRPCAFGSCFVRGLRAWPVVPPRQHAAYRQCSLWFHGIRRPRHGEETCARAPWAYASNPTTKKRKSSSDRPARRVPASPRAEPATTAIYLARQPPPPRTMPTTPPRHAQLRRPCSLPPQIPFSLLAPIPAARTATTWLPAGSIRLRAPFFDRRGEGEEEEEELEEAEGGAGGSRQAATSATSCWRTTSTQLPRRASISPFSLDAVSSSAWTSPGLWTRCACPMAKLPSFLSLRPAFASRSFSCRSCPRCSAQSQAAVSPTWCLQPVRSFAWTASCYCLLPHRSCHVRQNARPVTTSSSVSQQTVATGMILVALRERRGGAAAPPPPPGHGGHVEEETSRCREIRCLRAWRGGASASPLPRVSASTRHRYRFLVLHHHRTKSPLISPRPSRRKSSR